MGQSPATRAWLLGASIAAVLGLLHWLGIGLPLLLGLAVVVAVVTWLVPRLGVRWAEDLVLALRTWFWSREEGRHHSFGGVPLYIADDGLHVWVDGEGLQRVMGTRDSEQVLAARHAGHWQRSHEGRLMLRVDSVVQHLNTMPGRDAPRVQKLRRYFEREVLYPAARRQGRPK
jgi:hypothetical protein